MKKRISSILLFAFLLPSLGFVGIKNSTLQQETPSHKSVVWGFECNTWYGQNTDWLFEYFKTYDTAQEVSNLLIQHGYTADLQKNPAALDTIRTSLESAEIFFYIGHGTPNALAVTDEKCNGFGVTKEHLSNIDTSKLQFVLLSACETGKDVSQPDSILRAFKDAGVSKVIGFNRTMSIYGIEQWSRKFWKYAIQDSMEVSDAAHRAASEMERMGFQSTIFPGWITTNSLIILGTEPVHLGYEEKIPDFRQGLEQFFQDLWKNVQNRILQTVSQMIEKINAWWANQWSKIQNSIEKWIQEQLLHWLETLSKELEKILTQICFQPASAILIFAGIFIFQSRRNL